LSGILFGYQNEPPRSNNNATKHQGPTAIFNLLESRPQIGNTVASTFHFPLDGDRGYKSSATAKQQDNMPRLGQGDEPAMSPRRRGPSLAFARTPKVNIRNVALALIGIFILRNILRNDYRSEQIKYLKDSGTTQDEIARFIPKTPEERQQYVNDKSNDTERMKKDIAYLLQEVNDLKAHLRPKGSQGGRDSGLLEMDHLHQEKRKLHEEQLLKEHPDFKASDRLRKVDS
jgi:hypothetical protein